jgi:signal-transduction protein with cAMP-binding, CBS, and nucleotidyltransferase domain
MEIIEVATGLKKKVIITEVESKDFKILTKKRYFFDWRAIKGVAAIYKLQIENESTILGIVGVTDFPNEKRLEIKLIASSIENQGKNKKYDWIAGCLIAYVGSLAVEKYRQEACVSLIPKTELINHYMRKYHMIYGGWQLYIEKDSLEKILKEYYEL